MPLRDADDRNLSFLEHLEELRTRLIKSIVILAIGVTVGWFLAPRGLDLLTEPVLKSYHAILKESSGSTLRLELAADNSLRVANREDLGRLRERFAIEIVPEGAKEPAHVFYPGGNSPIIYLRPMDPFLIRMKAAMVIGIILSLPVVLHQAWAFVTPGLLPKERRLALPVIIAGSLLFPIGAVFAYFLLDVTLMFLSQFAMSGVAVQNDATAYLGFALTMMLAFGAVFELPLVVLLATRVGIVSTEWLAKRRGVIFIIQLTLCAIVTPSGDPVTLLAMSLPLQLLFELALITSRMMDRASAGGDVGEGTGEARES